jgi:hypothetical protein
LLVEALAVEDQILPKLCVAGSNRGQHIGVRPDLRALLAREEQTADPRP